MRNPVACPRATTAPEIRIEEVHGKRTQRAAEK
jgi:hypothetical protein